MKPIVAANSSVRAIATHMFMSSSVASRPMNRPAVPVMTPAERSNSPPIMSSATATAGMPSVDATSVQFAAPSTVPNRSVVNTKNRPITVAASTAPISGRRRRRVVRLTFARRSSTTDVGGGVGGLAAVAGLVTSVSSSSWRERRPAQARAGRSPFTSARALGGELLHRVGVRLVHEPGSGEHGQTAAHRVGVRVEQRQEDDRQVTLEVLLLVDGELDLAGLDGLHDVAAQVECGELGVRARALDRVASSDRDVGVEGQDSRDVLVRLKLRLQLRGGCGDVVYALDLDVLDRAAKALLRTCAALLEPAVALLMNHAQELPAGALGEPLAGRLAGHALVLANVGDRSKGSRVALAGVERDDRDACVRGLLERIAERVGIRHRGGDAVHLLGDRRVDQLGVLLRVVL